MCSLINSVRRSECKPIIAYIIISPLQTGSYLLSYCNTHLSTCWFTFYTFTSSSFAISWSVLFVLHTLKLLAAKTSCWRISPLKIEEFRIQSQFARWQRHAKKWNSRPSMDLHWEDCCFLLRSTVPQSFCEQHLEAYFPLPVEKWKLADSSAAFRVSQNRRYPISIFPKYP